MHGSLKYLLKLPVMNCSWVVIKTGFTLGHCSAAITVHIVSIEHFSYFLGNSTQIRLPKLHTLIKSLYIDWSVWIKVNILFYVYL